MSVNPSPFGPSPQFMLASGLPAVGYKLFAYVAGSVNTKQSTFTDHTGGVANTNPLVLNALGMPATELWFSAGLLYKLVLAPATDTDPPSSPLRTWDYLSGINDTTTSLGEWASFGFTPTYVSATSFTVAGDQTSTLAVGRRIKATVTAGTRYGTILASAFSVGITTVTVALDSGSLDSGLSAVDLGLLTPANPSAPALIAPFTGAVPRLAGDMLGDVINVKNLGAKGNFNPVTGVGDDDRVAVQAALDAAKSLGRPCAVLFPAGNYYLGTGYTDSTAGVAAQLLLGSRSVANAAQNIRVVGENAAIFAGAAGRALMLANCVNVQIEGLKFVGYAGGVLTIYRELDALISLSYSCRHITLQHCYLTNCLGWTIEGTGDPTVVNGGTGHTQHDIRIINNIIKQRYGNGVPCSIGAGTTGYASMRAMQFIDVHDLLVEGNTIYGNIDLEPSMNGQYIAYCDINSNHFAGGFVTPIVPAGVADYWADEVIGTYDGGGSRIVQAVAVSGVPASPKVRGNCIHDNTFDYGTISVGVGGVYLCDVMNNRFELGKIVLGGAAAPTTRFQAIVGNVCRAVTDGTNGFIELAGNVSYTAFCNNQVLNQDVPVVALNGGTDAGHNLYVANQSMISTTQAVNVGLTAASRSFEADSLAGNRMLLQSTVFHSGGLAPATATTGTDTTPSTTETYLAEVHIPQACTLTGISLLNGSAVAGNIQLALADSTGVIIGNTASTAQSGIAAYQQVAFSAVIRIGETGRYFIVAQFNNVGARFRSHALGNFFGGKLTGTTYGTFATFTPPTTFTANLAPVADVY